MNMKARLTHLRRRDVRFLVFVLLNIFCMTGYLLANIEAMQQDSGGWRRIDLDAVLTRIESGDLMQHEAAWYHNKETEKQMSASETQ